MKYTDTINQLIIDRKLTENQLDKKSWKSFQSYLQSHENNDVRYDFVARLLKKWPGGTLEQWLTRCPISYKVESSGKEYYIDYGKGGNSVIQQNINLFVTNPELAYEYKMFHTPEIDHCPIPRSKGGQNVFSNCRVVPKYANQASLDLDLDQIIDAAELELEVYKSIREELAAK